MTDVREEGDDRHQPAAVDQVQVRVVVLQRVMRDVPTEIVVPKRGEERE